MAIRTTRRATWEHPAWAEPPRTRSISIGPASEPARSLPHDFLYPAWPTAAQFNDWPVIRVNGDIDVPGDGKGILIVTGNMTISGSKRWDGLVLVGGTLTSNGNNTIQGAIVTGLNIKVGIRRGPDSRRER